MDTLRINGMCFQILLYIGCNALLQENQFCQEFMCNISRQTNNISNNLEQMKRATENTSSELSKMQTRMESYIENEKGRNISLLQNDVNILKAKVASLEENITQAISKWQKAVDEKLQGGKAYYLNDSKKSWVDARESCLESGMDLVSIETSEEQNVIASLINTSEMKSNCMEFWTSGVAIMADQGIFVWTVDFKHVMTSLWAANEPSGDGRCINVHEIHHFASINDASCRMQSCYICEG